MPVVVLPITIEQFHQLPHNPAYKYEYFGGKAHLSPRPRTFHAVIKLAKVKPAEPPRDVKTRKLKSTDWQRLPRLFAAAFHREQPYAGLDDATGRRAARESLRNTRLGRDGPLIKAACLVAVDAKDDRPVGALLTTLIPAGKVSDWDSYLWRKPPPANAVAERRGRAHLTWIFVSPRHAGSGVGSGLLAAAAQILAG